MRRKEIRTHPGSYEVAGPTLDIFPFLLRASERIELASVYLKVQEVDLGKKVKLSKVKLPDPGLCYIQQQASKQAVVYLTLPTCM